MSYTHEWYEKNKESLNKSSRDYYKRKRLDKVKTELSMINRVSSYIKYAGFPMDVEDYLNAALDKRVKKLKDAEKAVKDAEKPWIYKWPYIL